MVGGDRRSPSWSGCPRSTVISTGAGWSRRGGDVGPVPGQLRTPRRSGHRRRRPALPGRAPRTAPPHGSWLPDAHPRRLPSRQHPVRGRARAPPDRARRLAGHHRLQGRARPGLPAEPEPGDRPPPAARTSPGRRYHAQLEQHGVSGYTAEQCWEDYCQAALWLFEYAIIIGGGLDPANERGTAFMSGLVERSSQTIVDLDLLDLLPPEIRRRLEPARAVPPRRPGRGRDRIGSGHRTGDRVGAGRRRVRRHRQRPPGRATSRRPRPAWSARRRRAAGRRRRHP